MGDRELEDRIREISTREGRFPPAAYLYVYDALDHALKRTGGAPAPARSRTAGSNVSGRDLLEAALDLAVERYGGLARDVLGTWGLRRTDDVGAVVFSLVDAELLRKTDSDSPADYHEVFDMGETFDRLFRERLSREAVRLPARRPG